MSGNNESIVKNASVPHSELKKRHMALSYHKTREAIASGMVAFYHSPGKSNPVDILSKNWGFVDVWPLLKAVLFWSGETEDIKDKVASKKAVPQAKGEYYEFVTGSAIKSATKDKLDWCSFPNGRSTRVMNLYTIAYVICMTHLHKYLL